ncbi:MAG: formylglycine-generating enzyme family protein, partial [Jaaginema sp. PMC 1080.18]|nr:formylglycine-generating enzyme family protein [Jaaginema sp. PMC 1080.18]
PQQPTPTPHTQQQPTPTPKTPLLAPLSQLNITQKLPIAIPLSSLPKLSRRRMLQVSGWASMGFLAAWLGNRLLFGKSEGISELKGLPTQTETFETVAVNTKGEVINRSQHSAEVISEDIGNDITLAMAYVPGGTFKMGASEGEKDSTKNEIPQREVTVAAFLMSKYAITQQQWRQVASLPKLQRDLNPDPSKSKGDDRPVEQVSWHDAVEFCARLSVATKQNYYLPSEAQWEYACRGGTTTPFHFGESITTELANYNGNYTYAEGSKGQYREETTPVGTFSPNSFGLYDMHGNIWEWCADPWHENYEGAPTDGRVWHDDIDDNRYQNYPESLSDLLNDKLNHILRGGSWFNYPKHCRSANRNRSFDTDAEDINIGFRVVRSIPQAS